MGFVVVKLACVPYESSFHTLMFFFICPKTHIKNIIQHIMLRLLQIYQYNSDLSYMKEKLNFCKIVQIRNDW